MDSSLFQLLGGLFALVLLFYTRWCSSRKTTTKQCKTTTKIPEPSGALPLIGHLHMLGGTEPAGHVIGRMTDKYGPILTLRLGIKRTLVISNWELAKECYTTHDKIFSSRPRVAAAKYMGYDHAVFGFAPYGPYWREVRKIAQLELLSKTRLDALRSVRSAEIDNGMKCLFGLWEENGRSPVKVEMTRWFGDLSFNLIIKMVAGKRYFGNTDVSDEGEARRFIKALSKLSYLIGVFVPSDVLPFLEWMDIGGHIKEMKKTSKELDTFTVKWLEEHRRRRRSSGGGDDQNGERDFIDVMLSYMEANQLPGFDPDTVIKATALSVILGGADTTAVALTWALCLLLNNHHVLQKARQELDTHVGNNKNVDESDIKNLVYLQSIIKETLRLYPVAPLSVPRESTEDCQLGGFHVSKGTRLLVNLRKLQRDPRVWSDPSEFRPERFLTSHAKVDLRGQHFELIPFGGGRRSCPGGMFSVQVVSLVVARLIHGFELATPLDEPVDMSEGLGMNVTKKIPLDVLLTPRLPSRLYEL